MTKPPFPMDERTRVIIMRVCTIMYVLTLTALLIDILFRQFVLGQSSDSFNDIAMIYTFNVIILIGAILYFGGVPFLKIRLKPVLALFIVMAVSGTIFTIIKYRLTDPIIIINKFGIIIAIVTIFFLIWITAAFFGKRNIDKNL
ncbi:MAG: hypothetical protein HQ528_00575 [Candidatus Marinimicrobia bacterium]|nr:hypothetical protein [Candidatus Neomarinimicrobiota bacterium]